MTRNEIEYYLNNMKFCINYLKELRDKQSDIPEHNKIHNHALAVEWGRNIMTRLYEENNDLKARIRMLESDIRELKSGEFRNRYNDKLIDLENLLTREIHSIFEDSRK